MTKSEELAGFSRRGENKRRPAYQMVIFGLVVLFVSVGVSLLLLEIGLRVYSGIAFPKMMVFDEKLGWRHTPDASRIFVNEFGEKAQVVQNAYGQRGSFHGVQRTPGFFRVLVLGDSFTEGVQVGEKELLTSRIEAADSHTEVFNSGVGGYGTVQEYLYLSSQGLEFHPDMVLLMFFENDLTDNLLSYYPGIGPRPYATMTDGQFQIVERLDPSDFEKFILPSPFRIALNNHSYLYYLLNSRIYQRIFANRMTQLQQSDMRRFDVETRYQTFYRVLQRLDALLVQQKIPLLVVLIPSREEVAAGHSDPVETIDKYCSGNNMHCLSLLERFRQEASSGTQLYFPFDMHWTKEGHRVAADEILKYLRSNGEVFRGAFGASTNATPIH